MKEFRFPKKALLRRLAAFVFAACSPLVGAADAVIGLNFCDQSATPHISGGTADGFNGWTDSRAVGDATSPAVQTTPLALGASGVSVTWSASNIWGGGSQGNKEQALYRLYLDDGGSGVRVTISGLSNWLAANGKAAYRIRCYAASDSATSFMPISIRSGADASGPVLHAMSPTILGNGDFPTPVTLPTGLGPARGYVDSPSTLTDDTITLTIPARYSSGARGALAAFKITAPALPPVASTLAATNVTDVQATLNGTANGKGDIANVSFQYGTTTSYGSTVVATPATVTGITATAVSGAIAGLSANTTYHYRAVATGAAGTSYGPDRTFKTNPPAVVTLTPNPIAFSVRSGESASMAMELANTGTGATNWTSEVTDGNNRADNLEGALAAIDGSGTTLNAPLPSRFDFSEGETGTYINSGDTSGISIFSQGNKLNTSQGGPLAYSNGVVASSSTLGAGGRYFTRKLPGLFIFAGDLNGPSWFEIAGTISYASSRQTSDFSMVRNGKRWSVFVSKTVDYWRTINQMILVDQDGLSQTTSTNVSNEQQRVSGLAGKRRVYYLLFVTSNTTIQPDSVFEDLAGRLLNTVPMPLNSMMTVAPPSGTALANSTTPLTATANAFGLPEGTYALKLNVKTTAGSVLSSVPATLEVTAPRLTLPATISQTAVPGMMPITVEVPMSSNLPEAQPWSASIPNAPAWLSVVTSAGTAPEPLKLRFDAGALAAGTYRSSVRITAGPATFEIPVVFTIAPLAITKILPDPVRPLVYALNSNGNEAGTLLVMDAATHKVTRSITLGRRPTDIDLSADAARCYAINTLDKTITEINLASLVVAATHALPVYTDWDSTVTHGHVRAGKGNILYYVDGQWGPRLHVFDKASGTVLQTFGASTSGSANDDGIGGLVVSPDGSRILTWNQYGWSAGSTGTSVSRFKVNTDGTLTFETRTTSSALTNFARNPLSTPALVTVDGTRLVVKDRAFEPANLAEVKMIYPDEIHSITPGGELAAGESAVYTGSTASSLYTLPVTTSVQAMMPDYSAMVYFNPTTKAVGWLDLAAAIGFGPMGLAVAPADGSVVAQPTQLRWLPSAGVYRYQVYLGTDRAEVESATPDSPTYLGTTLSPWFALSTAWVPGQGYFWRVVPLDSTGTAIGTGTTRAFTASQIVLSRTSIDAAGVTGAKTLPETIQLTASSPQSWSAGTDVPWITFVSGSGTTPSELKAVLSAANLAAGFHQGNITITSGGSSFRIPVSFRVHAANFMLAEADLELPYVYVISQENSNSTLPSFLVRINTATNQIEAAVPCGRSVTDLVVHYAENRVYLTNFQTGVLRAFDRTTFTEVQTYQFAAIGGTGYGEGGVWRVAAGRSGRVILEESDQWIDIRLIDTANGAVLATKSSIYAGDGEADPTGRYYYHSESLSTNAVTRFDLAADTFAAMTPVGTASSANVVIIPDGSKVAVGTKIFNSQLGLQYTLPAALVAGTLHGDLLFTSNKAYNGVNGLELASLPVTSSLMSVTGDQRKLYQFAANTKTFNVVDLSTIAVLPPRSLTPAIADGATVNGTGQQLGWSIEPFAISYQVFFGTDRDAVANATTASPEYLGTTQSTSWTGTPPNLVLDGVYYWRVDVVGYAGASKGAVWSFNIAPLTISPGSLDVTLPVSAPVETRTLAITGPAGMAWSASTTTAWITLARTSGTTPGSLDVRLNPAALAAGIHNGSIQLQAGSDTWSVPVRLELLALNYTMAKADLEAPYIYAISQAASGTDDRAFLVVIDARTNALTRMVPVGRSVTDFAIHYAENRIYLTNFKSGVLIALDRTSLEQVQTYQFAPVGPTGYGEGGIWRVSAGKRGRVILEESDQWIDIRLVDTANGNVLATRSSIYVGDGDADPTGRYYYHCEALSSNAVTRFDLSADTFVAMTPLGTANSGTVVVVPDGSKIAVGKKVFNPQLGLQFALTTAVAAATVHGELLFTNNSAVNGVSSQPVATLPVDTAIQAVSADQKKLFQFKAGAVTVVDITAMAALPPRGLVPGIADGATVIGTAQELSWSQEPAVLSYDVYFGTSAAAVTAATKDSEEYLGNVTETKWTGSLPPLSIGTTYYWRVDMNGFSSTNKGSAWSFGIASVDVTPRAVKLAAPAGSPVPRQVLAMTAGAATAWTASTTTPWITLISTSGATPGSLQFDINTTGQTVGTKSGFITLQAAGKSFTVPVELSIVTLNITKLINHPNRPVVYGINTALAGEGFCQLLEIDASTATIQRTLPIGFAPTDADLDPANERLYISNWGYSQTRVIDVATWAELPALSLGEDVYKLEITPNGRLVTEGEDQWVSLKLWNAATAINLVTATSVREGDGQADPTGGFYYHCDNNSSGAILRKYNIAADTFVQSIAGPQIGYGSRNLILSGDGKRLFWLGRTLDENLNVLATMPSNAEVHATNRTGELAVGESAIWWSDSGTQLATLPFASSVAAVSSNDTYLVRFNATTRTLQSTAIATLTDLPGPWPRPGQILNETPQRLSWTPVAGASGYRVYIAADATALQAMTAPTATVTTPYYDLPAPLAFGRYFTWRVDAVVGAAVTTGKVQSFSIRFPQGPVLASSTIASGAGAASFGDRGLLLGFGNYSSGAQLYGFDPATGGSTAVQSFSLPGTYYDHYFGCAVALDAGKAAVGAYTRDNPADGGGNAYLFLQGTNGYLETSGPLAPPTPAANEGFGLGLAASGNLMLAGTSNTYSLTGRVVAYVTEPAAIKTQVFSATDGAAGDAFGKVIVMDGNRAVISAPGAGSSYNRIPCLYAYSRSTATGLWSQSQKIAIPGASASSVAGGALALSGTLMATRASSTGVVIYTETGANQWTYSTTISNTAVTGASSSFGSGLALHGDMLLIGDPNATYSGTSGGAVFTFRRSGSSWVQGPVLTPDASRSGFGQALAARDGWLLVAGTVGDRPAGIFRIQENANSTPRFMPGIPNQVVAGRPFSVPVRAEDANGNAGLAITKLQGPSWLVVTDNGNGEAVLSGTPSGPAGTAQMIQLGVRDAANVQTLWTYQLTVLSPTDVPTLTQEPVNTHLGEGQELVLRAAVSGIGPFQWQWYRNGEPISGANRDSLVIGEVSLADAGTYRVRVSNVVGEDLSADALVTVHQANRYAGDWLTFGNSPSHTGRHPAALDACHFVPTWTRTVQSGSGLNRAAIADGRAVVVPQGYFVNDLAAKAFDLSTGAPLWSFAFPSSYSSNPPSVFNGRVYFQRGKGTGDVPQLFCLNAATGAKIWASTYGAQWESYEAPAITEKGIFVNGGAYGGIYGFNFDGTQRFFQDLPQNDEWTPTLSNGRLFSWVGGTFIEHNPTDGTTLWSLTGQSGTGVTAVQEDAAVLLGTGVRCVDLSTRSLRWQVAGNFSGRPAIAAGRVFGIQGNTVRGYSLADGSPGPVYQTNSSGTLLDQPILFNDRLVISSEVKTWVFNLADGQLLQTLDVGGRLSYSNSYLLIAGSDGILRAFRALHYNANLANLALNQGTLLPAFDPSTTDYITTVPFATDNVALTPATEQSDAIVKVNGTAVASGTASNAITLAVGNTTIPVVVTAEDGITIKNYTITVTRLPREFVFNSAGDVPVTANGFSAGGHPVNIVLNHAPEPGTILTMVNNTGLGFIAGRFGNLDQGQKIVLSFGGTNYDFVVNYYGGSGNDLVLQWADARLFAWGSNSYGQLGDATTSQRLVPSPVNVAGVLSGKTMTAAKGGYLHSLALCSDGTLAAWGYNVFGQLGNDSSAPSSVPVAVERSGALAGKTVVAISVGPFHNLALCSDGTVVAWGYNNYGQLGTGDKLTSRVPVRVKPLGALAGKSVVGIAAGAYHSFALCSDGTVAGWGYNDDGELGDGSVDTTLVPVMVDASGSLSGRKVASLAAGQYHALALCTDGTLHAWGYNKNGQLGDNSTVSRKSPVAIGSFGALAGKTVTAISAGASHSMATCSDGTLAVWGLNSKGQLGVSGLNQSMLPVPVGLTGLSGLRGNCVGASHSMVMTSDGTLYGWGDNASGQLGNNSTVPSASPQPWDAGSFESGMRLMSAASGASSQHAFAIMAGMNSVRPSAAAQGDGSASQDSDQDGITDLLEYAFGLNPNRADANELPRAAWTDGSLQIRFVQPAGVVGVVYSAEWSASLKAGEWFEIPDTGTGSEHVFRIPGNLKERCFMRLKVTRP